MQVPYLPYGEGMMKRYNTVEFNGNPVNPTEIWNVFLPGCWVVNKTLSLLWRESGKAKIRSCLCGEGRCLLPVKVDEIETIISMQSGLDDTCLNATKPPAQLAFEALRASRSRVLK